MPIPETPECDKMIKVRQESQNIGEFLEWLSEQGIHLCKYVQFDEYDEPELTLVFTSVDQLLANFYKIDLAVCEQEKRALLEYINPS